MYAEPTPDGEGNVVDNVFTQQCADDPHEVYAEVLSQCPVSRRPGIFGNHDVSIARYEDVLWALKHYEVFTSKGVVDIGGEFPKPWTDETVRAADVVITMGSGDACPVFPGKRYEDWPVDDPAGQDLDTVRRIRDDVERRVRTLLDDLRLAAASTGQRGPARVR